MKWLLFCLILSVLSLPSYSKSSFEKFRQDFSVASHPHIDQMEGTWLCTYTSAESYEDSNIRPLIVIERNQQSKMQMSFHETPFGYNEKAMLLSEGNNIWKTKDVFSFALKVKGEKTLLLEIAFKMTRKSPWQNSIAFPGFVALSYLKCSPTKARVVPQTSSRTNSDEGDDVPAYTRPAPRTSESQDYEYVRETTSVSVDGTYRRDPENRVYTRTGEGRYVRDDNYVCYGETELRCYP